MTRIYVIESLSLEHLAIEVLVPLVIVIVQSLLLLGSKEFLE